MKVGKIIVIGIIWAIVFGLGFWLYKIIQDPVQFEKDYNERYTATTGRMSDIRTAQSYYLQVKGVYAGNFDELIKVIQNEKFSEVVINGNPDDTNQVASYDTLKYFIKDKIQFVATLNIDSLKFVPYSGGELFEIEASTIQMQRVVIPVYQVLASKDKYLKNLKKEYVERKEDITLGSLSEATEKGSWE